MNKFMFPTLVLTASLLFSSVATASDLGDANGDGSFNNLDIAPFVMALTNPKIYGAMYPNVDPDVKLDMNGDGVFDNLDISGFVAALVSGVEAPTDLRTIPSSSPNAIGLAWTASSTEGVIGYRVTYGLDSGNLTDSLDVGNVTSATVTGLTPSQTYYLAVVALTCTGESQAGDALITAQADMPASIVDLFNGKTPLEAATTVETPGALFTYIADRARDRHAREAEFQAYDHYLSWYWEQRVANIEIVDRVGRNGGTDITFNYTTQRPCYCCGQETSFSLSETLKPIPVIQTVPFFCGLEWDAWYMRNRCTSCAHTPCFSQVTGVDLTLYRQAVELRRNFLSPSY